MNFLTTATGTATAGWRVCQRSDRSSTLRVLASGGNRSRVGWRRCRARTLDGAAHSRIDAVFADRVDESCVAQLVEHGLSGSRQAELGVSRVTYSTSRCSARAAVTSIERDRLEVEHQAAWGCLVERLDRVLDEVVGVGEEQRRVEPVDDDSRGGLQGRVVCELVISLGSVGAPMTTARGARSARSAARARGTRRGESRPPFRARRRPRM